ncbi:putative tubulin-specific chaperone Rbl2 [Diplocarpon rosae]|nr:putative tubulin-specific chaperone Rbl2 [Diplocarpon rosae]
MAPPSPLAIATSALQRLVKEEGSYENELKEQETRLKKILATKDEDENAEYKLKQERAAIEETRAVFPPLRERISDALKKLEDQVEAGKSTGSSEEELTKAKEAIENAKKSAKPDAKK